MEVPEEIHGRIIQLRRHGKKLAFAVVERYQRTCREIKDEANNEAYYLVLPKKGG